MTEPTDAASAVKRRVEYLLGSDVHARWSTDQQLGWAGVMEIARLLPPKHNREMLTHDGMSLTLLSLLGRLEACDGKALQARDLATDLDISPGKISRHLSSLEAMGLLTRSHNTEDGRAHDVTITAAGRTRLASARAHAFDIVERDFLSRLTRAEIATLASVALKLLSTADEPGTPAVDRPSQLPPE